MFKLILELKYLSPFVKKIQIISNSEKTLYTEIGLNGVVHRPS